MQANYALAVECCCQGYLFSQTVLILYAHTQLCLLIPQWILILGEVLVLATFKITFPFTEYENYFSLEIFRLFSYSCLLALCVTISNVLQVILKSSLLNDQIGQMDTKPFLWVRRRPNPLSDWRYQMQTQSQVTVVMCDGLVCPHQLICHPFFSKSRILIFQNYIYNIAK